MGTGNDGLRPFLRLADIHYINLYVVALAYILAADLFVFGKHGLGLADPKGDGPGFGVDPLYQSADQFLVL